jgi:hypothetical protein
LGAEKNGGKGKKGEAFEAVLVFWGIGKNIEEGGDEGAR